jgi:hypothetical protein
MGSEWSGWAEAGAHRQRNASARRRMDMSCRVLVGFLHTNPPPCSMGTRTKIASKKQKFFGQDSGKMLNAQDQIQELCTR